MDFRLIDASPMERVEHLLTVIACALTRQPADAVAWWRSQHRRPHV